MRQSLKRWFFVVAGLCAAVFLVANAYVLLANSDRVYEDVSAVPVREIGLVLGTSRVLRSGQPNLQFSHRVSAAAKLYHAGKVRRLLLSGGHTSSGYDEALMMQRDLLAAGVPLAAIVRDNAGYRTLDSVVRARRVFGVTSCTIISQHYHASRALQIAHVHGVDAVAFCALDPDIPTLLKSQIRESAARVMALLDLYVWNRKPRQTGPSA